MHVGSAAGLDDLSSVRAVAVRHPDSVSRSGTRPDESHALAVGRPPHPQESWIEERARCARQGRWDLERREGRRAATRPRRHGNATAVRCHFETTDRR